MKREDIEFLKGKETEIQVPHLFLDRPYHYYGVIVEITDEKVTLEQRKYGKRQGVIDIAISDIICIKSRNWEVS